MRAPPSTDALRLLEGDLVSLSAQASKVEGGVFGGLFAGASGPADPEVTRCVDAALVALRGWHESLESELDAKASIESKTFAAIQTACVSKSPVVVMHGLACAQRLVSTSSVSLGNYLKLVEGIGYAPCENLDNLFDEKCIVRRAQILLAIAERAPCFEETDDGRQTSNTPALDYVEFSQKLTDASFKLLHTAEQLSGSENNSAAVAAEAAAFRIVEVVFSVAVAESDSQSDSVGTPVDAPFQRMPKTQVAFALFQTLCDSCRGTKRTSHDSKTAFVSKRFALDALSSALAKAPRENVLVTFSKTKAGVSAIKTKLVTALVSSVFSNSKSTAQPSFKQSMSVRGISASLSPSRTFSPTHSFRYESPVDVAEGRAAVTCAGAFLKFTSRVRERNRKEMNSETKPEPSLASTQRNTPGEPSGSGFFSFLTSPSKRDLQEDDVESLDALETSSEGREKNTNGDTFAAERFLFLGSFASSLESEMAPWRRSCALDVLRQVAGGAYALRDAYGNCSDGYGTHKNNAFTDVVKIIARVAQAGVSVDENEDDNDDSDFSNHTRISIPSRVATCFRDAAFGSRGVSQTHAPDDEDDMGHIAHAVFLALDGVVAACLSLETLVESAKENESELKVVTAMLSASWFTLESCLSIAFKKVPGEDVTLELCRAYQALTRACATVGLDDAKDACLLSLSAFATFGLDGNISKNNGTPSRNNTPTSTSSHSKRTHALRALLNVAQSLVVDLGHRGWFVVLETCRRLEDDEAVDTINASSENNQRYDFEALLASAGRLFATSASLGFDNAMDALDASRGSSVRELDDLRFAKLESRQLDSRKPDSAVPTKTYKLNALQRFADAAVLRVTETPQRWRPVWSTLEQHFSDILDIEKDTGIINEVCVTLRRATVGVLEGLPVEGVPTEGVSESNSANVLDVSQILAPIVRTIRTAKSSAARFQSMETLVFLIRERGEIFSTQEGGWVSAFNALRIAIEFDAEKNSNTPEPENRKKTKKQAPVVAAGWAAVAVAVSDIMPTLISHTHGNTDAVGSDDTALDAVVLLVSQYATQKADTRTSLSAVNALWNACDFFGRLFADSKIPKFHGSALLSERLLLPTFEALAVVSVDHRPDVRHSGINTLANVVASHGGKLSQRAFALTMTKVFFPLFQKIDEKCRRAGDEGVDVEFGDGDGNTDSDGDGDATDARTAADNPPTTTLLVHHSRNTFAKQWDETRGVLCSGVGKLVRQKASELSSVPGFAGIWQGVCGFIVETVATGSTESASAALATLRLSGVKFATLSIGVELSRTSGSKPENEKGPSFKNIKIVPKDVREVSSGLFRDVLGVYELITEGTQAVSSQVSAKTRQELCKSLAGVFSNAPTAFDANGISVVLEVTDLLIRNPEPYPEWYTLSVTNETTETASGAALPAPKQMLLTKIGSGYNAYNTQKVCVDLMLQVLPNLSDDSIDRGAYGVLMALLLQYVRAASSTNGTSSTSPQPSTQPSAMSYQLAASAATAIGKIVCDSKLPGDDLSKTFAEAVQVLSSAMASRGSGSNDASCDYDSCLWKAACTAFHQLLHRGLPATVKYASASGGASGSKKHWSAIAETFETYLLRDRDMSSIESETQNEAAEVEQLDFDTLRLLRDVVILRSDAAEEEIVARLVNVLTAGADAGFSSAECARLKSTTSDAEAALPLGGSSSEAPQIAFPIQCLKYLRDIASSTSTRAAKHAAPAVLNKCESALRWYAAEESIGEGNDLSTSTARAAFAANALTSVFAHTWTSTSQSGWFGRKETSFSILEDAATPEYRSALRDALRRCAASSDDALGTEVRRAMQALDEFEQ